MRRYTVTLYNQHADTHVSATGRTRVEAFKRATAKAGEPWLREGGDKLTTLRTLFAGLMETGYYRTAKRVSSSHPNGACVEWVRES